ncbi:MAG: zinc ribbon domain-containing protein [Chloroflexi bacterium]|nr:zinc ribbon domain-containing protein [Chloroflexota bacterium]
MPFYEYQCQKCGCKFELRRGIDESDADIECPSCRARTPKRLLSRFTASSSAGSCSPSGFT